MGLLLNGADDRQVLDLFPAINPYKRSLLSTVQLDAIKDVVFFLPEE